MQNWDFHTKPGMALCKNHPTKFVSNMLYTCLKSLHSKIEPAQDSPFILIGNTHFIQET